MSTLPATIAALIGPDVSPADDALLADLAEAVRDVHGHEHQAVADDLFCANLLGWMGQRMPAVLARLLGAGAIIAEQRALILEAAIQINPCPTPNLAEHFELCSHGFLWPCRRTEAAWRLRGLDPKAEKDRILRAVLGEDAYAQQVAGTPGADIESVASPS